jgi:hypothetical protein
VVNGDTAALDAIDALMGREMAELERSYKR